MLDVQRSPAKVSWWVVFNGVMIATTPTKKAAIAKADKLAREFGIKLSTRVLNHVL